jgi:hypothetical protein
MRLRRAVLAALVISVLPVTASAQEPMTGTMVIPTELQDLINHVSGLTDLTATQITDIYYNHPTLIPQLPYSVVDEDWVTVSTATATELSTQSTTYTTRYCTVTTRKKVRNNIGLVMYSFKMWQKWGYNGFRVFPHTPAVDYDITGNGWAWSWDGVSLADGWYHSWSGSSSAYAAHKSRRYGRFVTHGPWPIYHTIKLFIDKAYHGDWATQNTVGLTGCREM